MPLFARCVLMLFAAGLSGVCVAGDVSADAPTDGLRLTLHPFAWRGKGESPRDAGFEFGFHLLIENAGEATQMIPADIPYFEIKPSEDGKPVQVVFIRDLRPKIPGQFRTVFPAGVYKLAAVEQWEALNIGYSDGMKNRVDDTLRKWLERGKYVGPSVPQRFDPANPFVDKPEYHQPWPDSPVEFIFRVEEEFAKRYGTWHGELKCVDPRLTVKNGRLHYDWPAEAE